MRKLGSKGIYAGLGLLDAQGKLNKVSVKNVEHHFITFTIFYLYI